MRIGWLVPLLVAVVIWILAGGRVSRCTRSLQILDELRRPGARSWLRRGTLAPIRGVVNLEAPGRRFVADLYRPASHASRVPMILVPGLVEAGKNDPRVSPFAELLARAGFVVLVPDLPSFRTLHAHPDNLAELGAAVDAVTARRDLAPRGRAGLFGISYAGGIAVLAALDPARARRVPFVAAVGAYADLDAALRFLATGRMFLRGRMRVVKPDPYGRLVHQRSAKNYQLDLFDPNDGYYEYSAVATNLDLSGRKLWHFMCGRGAHEKVIGELKNGLAFATIATRHYGANSAWQQLVALSHNLITNCQIETGAPSRPRSAKRTAIHVLKSMQTLRFELFHRAGRLVHPDGVTFLRMARNEPTRRLFLRIAEHLGDFRAA